MKKWKFGIVGTGLIADFHAMAIQSLPNAELTGFWGTNPEKTDNLVNKYGCKSWESYQQLMASEEVEIVAITTPSGAHMEPALEAARQGKHVICEKPLDITLERIDAMIGAHERAGTRLGGIFNFRYYDTLEPIRQAIEKDRFGNITYAAVHVPWWRAEAYYEGNWHGTWKLDGGGALMNQSIHMIDMLQYLMGPVESLSAFTATLAHDIEVEDTAAAVLRFHNKALGVIYGTTGSYPGQFRRLEITGTKGTVVMVENSYAVWQFAEEAEEDKEILQKFGEIEGGGGVSDPGAIPFEPHAKNISAFLDAVENDRPFEIDGPEARKSVEIILAIYESAKTQKMISFNSPK